MSSERDVDRSPHQPKKETTLDGIDPTALQERVEQAVDEAVARQVAAGVHVVNDGEWPKPSYATYVKDRLDGFGGDAVESYYFADLADYPRSAELVAANPGRRKRTAPACTSARISGVSGAPAHNTSCTSGGSSFAARSRYGRPF